MNHIRHCFIWSKFEIWSDDGSIVDTLEFSGNSINNYSQLSTILCALLFCKPSGNREKIKSTSIKVESRSNITPSESNTFLSHRCDAVGIDAPVIFFLAIFGACDERRGCDDMVDRLRVSRGSCNAGRGEYVDSVNRGGTMDILPMDE